MHALFVVLLVVFIVVERRIEQPFIDFRHFRHKYFSLSLVSNIAFHLSMLATMILLPIMIEDGLGKSPIFVTAILIPHQSFGIWLPAIAGNIHDKYSPKLLRTFCMLSIAVGFVLLAVFAAKVNFWLLPLLLLPISFGTNIFNTVNNATVMNALPTENRGFASGMLETTRDLGHATGATISSIIMAMVLPAGIAFMVASESQSFYMKGFQTASLAVVGIMVGGAIIAAFHRAYDPAKDKQREQASPAAADD
jgi:MFS family permease